MDEVLFANLFELLPQLVPAPHVTPRGGSSACQVGAFMGDWLLPRLGIHLGVGIVALIIGWRPVSTAVTASVASLGIKADDE
jgi:hypothetical protein